MFRKFWNRLTRRSSQPDDEQEYFIGIDFGTTKTAAAYGNFSAGGKVDLLGFDGKWQLPSVVAVELPGIELMAKKALKSRVGKYVVQAGYDVLREDATRIELGLFHRTKLSVGRGRFLERDTPRELSAKFLDLKPEHIAARILAEVHQNFFQKKNYSLKKATITIPASWDPEQRRATKMAAFMAGFTEVFLLEEPVAALINLIDLEEFKDKKAVVVVVDFGGGTCDVAGVEIENNIITLIGAGARNRLGGEIIDEILFDDFLSKIKAQAEEEHWDQNPSKQHSIENIQNDRTVRASVRKQIEEFKIKINEKFVDSMKSQQPQSKPTQSPSGEKVIGVEMEDALRQIQSGVFVEGGYRQELTDREKVGFQLTYELKFKDFDKLMKIPRPEISESEQLPPESVMQAFDKLLEVFSDKYLTDKKINRVYLVGGSSYLYFVPQRIQAKFQGYFVDGIPEKGKIIEEPGREEAVARGAAYFDYQRRKNALKFRSRLFYNLDLYGEPPIRILEENRIIEPDGINIKPKLYSLPNTTPLPSDQDIEIGYSRTGHVISGESKNKMIRHSRSSPPNAIIELAFRISADSIITIKPRDPEGKMSMMCIERYPVDKTEGLDTQITMYKRILY